jgi:hypothetical protein
LKTDDALAAEAAVEAKLAEAGADQVRRSGVFTEAPEAAPDTGTPAEVQRDEQGRFAAAEQPEAEAPGNVAEENQAEAVEADPAVANFLAKYGGDVDKALQGAVNLQRKAGEQSNELGELRRMVDELSQLRESIQANQQPQQQYLDQGTVDWFDQQVMSNPQGALEWARQQGNQILVQRGLDTWKDFDPYGAASYRNDLQLAAMRDHLAQQRAQQAQLPKDAAVSLALQNVRSRNPEFASFDEVLGSTLERYPFVAQQLKAAADSGDPSLLEGAIETAYGLARGDTLSAALRAGATPDETSTTTGVAVPATSEDREPEPAPPSATDLFRQQFREEADRQRNGIWTAH